ncbi:MAG: hypothetical protein EPN23_00385 [Verrucomicrobia bacterium]|nr:MAG: hypothetical protein EPN23_00385 [Verrucomicrobiota bacterium]
MSRPTRQQLWLGAAALAVTLGVALALHALSTLSDDLRRIERKAGDLATLQKIAADWRANQQAVQPFEALASKQPMPLAELFAQHVPGVTPSIRQREARPALAGWQARRTEVKGEAPLADLVQFLRAAADARPPWQLVEFDLTAAERAPGVARVTLVLEALEKK